MDAATFDITTAVLQQGIAAALRIDSARRICAAWNAGLLDSWLAPPADAAAASLHLADTLQRLFAGQSATAVMQQLDTVAAAGDREVHDLGTLPAGASHYGATPRQLALSVQRMADAADADLLLLLRDVTAAHELQLAVARVQAAADTGLALLRAPPAASRLFLGSALASVSALRSTLRMPARSRDALRDKLTRLQAGVSGLQHDAQLIQLDTVTQACSRLLATLGQLLQDDTLSGNDVLPLAPLIDRIAHAVGNAWRCEEQRYSEPQSRSATRTARDRRRARKRAGWPQASERRWNGFLRRRGEAIGKLAKLTVNGAELVPAAIHRDVDEMLLQLLRNALEHGIETPEQRLAASKPAAGEINVTFTAKGAAGLMIMIRDDGRGFDLQRIGRAAVQCGLIQEELLLQHDAGDLVGFIFRPDFTTAGLADSDGQGRGMTCLRNAVARLNGQVSVATKAGRYTQFTLHLPVGDSLHAALTTAYG